MSVEYERFKDTVRRGIKSGEIKTSAPLSEIDFAVQFAIGKIGEEKGYPCDITTDEICIAIKKYCGVDITEEARHEE